MKKISSATLNFENINNKRKLSQNVSKLNNMNNSEQQIEYVGSFGDFFLDIVGDNITKDTAVKLLKEADLNFINEDDIKEAYKIDDNEENIKIVMENGDSYTLRLNGSYYDLVSFTKDGKTCDINDGLKEIIENGKYGVGSDISNIWVSGNSLGIMTENGDQLFYDMTDNNKLTSVFSSVNNKMYNMDEVEKVIDSIRDVQASEIQEQIDLYGGMFPDIKETLQNQLNKVENQITFDKIESIGVADTGALYIKLEDYGKGWSIKFENGKAISAWYYDGANEREITF